MNIIFFAALLSMLLAAATFVAAPLYRAATKRDSGFTRLPFLVAVLVVGASIALYTVIGRPELAAEHSAATASRALATVAVRPSATDRRSAGTVESLLGGLEARLAQNPGDGKGWLLLAKSYDHLGRSADAATAYEKARVLGAADPAFEGGLTRGTAPAATAIHGSVRLTDRASGQVSPDDVVFVIARAADGNPMPLAVLRRNAGELPFDFTLDDSHSMVKDHGISAAGQLLVTARISPTGEALATSSAFSAPVINVAPGDASPVELVIDKSGGETE